MAANAAAAVVATRGPASCAMLVVLSKLAAASKGRGLSAAQVNLIVTETTRIRTVVGCGG